MSCSALTEVEDRGDVIKIAARVRDDTCARAIEASRGDQFNRGVSTLFTWSGRSKHVKVAGVHCTTTSSRSKLFSIELHVEDARRDSVLEMSIGGRTPDDLTEAALRKVLFGEPDPLTDRHMEFATEIADPFKTLREQPVSEEIIRPLSELLLTDILVGTGRANSVIAFSSGFKSGGVVS